MKAVFIPLLLFFTCSAGATQVEVGFSPEGSARQVVINAINSAQSSIHMMAYSFTAPDIMKALANANDRGVNVKIVVDEKGNRTKSSLAAMNYIVNHGIELRTDNNFRIQHDKVLIIDRNTVELGSFNYTYSAEKYNSENAMVIHDDPEIAGIYDKHWLDRWNRGNDYSPSY